MLDKDLQVIIVPGRFDYFIVPPRPLLFQIGFRYPSYTEKAAKVNEKVVKNEYVGMKSNYSNSESERDTKGDPRDRITNTSHPLTRLISERLVATDR